MYIEKIKGSFLFQLEGTPGGIQGLALIAAELKMSPAKLNRMLAQLCGRPAGLDCGAAGNDWTEWPE
jgi:hypothetical protein